MKHRNIDKLKTDCFAFRGANLQAYCSVLAGVKTCEGCKFYKSNARMQAEEERTRLRLKQIGRVTPDRKEC